MMPWTLRLLLAELPGHCGRQLEAMNRLLRLLRTVRELVVGQEAGRAVWREREVMVLHSLVNCSVMHQDFESAVKCLDMLAEVVEPEAEVPLHSAYGRLYLQLGSLPLAERHFGLAAAAREVLGEEDGQLDSLLDSAFLAIGQGQFQAALERFLRAEAAVVAGDTKLGNNNTNTKLGRAIGNNIAVCLLYVGRLKEGLAKLEASVTGDTENIQVGLHLLLLPSTFTSTSTCSMDNYPFETDTFPSRLRLQVRWHCFRPDLLKLQSDNMLTMVHFMKLIK